MPSLRKHLKFSTERTGKSYKELNAWLDGDEVSFLTKIDRHVMMGKHSRYVEERWGKRGVEEYRSHVKDDLRGFGLLLRKMGWTMDKR